MNDSNIFWNLHWSLKLILQTHAVYQKCNKEESECERPNHVQSFTNICSQAVAAIDIDWWLYSMELSIGRRFLTILQCLTLIWFGSLIINYVHFRIVLVQISPMCTEHRQNMCFWFKESNFKKNKNIVFG